MYFPLKSLRFQVSIKFKISIKCLIRFITILPMRVPLESARFRILLFRSLNGVSRNGSTTSLESHMMILLGLDLTEISKETEEKIDCQTRRGESRYRNCGHR